MEQNALAILLIGACMFIPLWIGAKAGEKDQLTVEDFFVQSRDMGLIAVLCTVQATWWSAFAFLGATAHYYNNGPVYWTTIAWDFLFALLFLVLGKRIWFYGKKNHYLTATDFFVDMYDSENLGILVTIIMMLFTIPYFQIQVSGGAYLIEAASGGLIPREMGAIVFTSVIVIYVWAGGLRAVAWADVFYEVLIVIGAVFAAGAIVHKFGSVKNLFQEIYSLSPDLLTLSETDPLGGPSLWISMFIIVPIGAMMAPPLWTRMYAVRDARIFNILPFLLGLISIVNIGPMLVGNAGIILQKNLIEGDALLPLMMLNHASIGVTYVVLIGGAAAAMSTSNSQIHSISALYTIDIHKRHIDKNVNDKKLINIGRAAIVVFALLSYLTYLYFPGLMVPIGLGALSGTAQIIVPVLGALFWGKSSAKGAIAGLLVSLAVLVIFFIKGDGLLRMHVGLVALAVNAATFIMVSLLTKTKTNVVNKISSMKEIYENQC